MTFQARKQQHGRTMSHVITAFNSVGYIIDDFGVETNNLDKQTQKELKDDTYRDDPVAHLIRFSPDHIAIHPEQSYFLELKTAGERHDNYSYELDSFGAVKSLSQLGCPVLLVFNGKKICFASDVGFDRVIVPSWRWSRAYADEIANEYPQADVLYTDTSGGSGTPFGLLDKEAGYLEEINRFLWCLDRAGKPTSRTEELQELLGGESR